MRAVVVSAHGGPEVLELSDRPDPTPGPGEVLVAVAAVGVNFADVYQREGRPPYAGTLPFVPGREGAGTVSALGPDVTGFAVGDRVVWTGVAASYAELVVVPVAQALPVPVGVELEVAAAVLVQGLTAHYLATSTFPVAANDVAVVHAGAGGTGRLLVQVLKLRGAIVVATTSTMDKAALAASAGADHVVSYEDMVGTVREVTGGSGAAVVYDGVGQATFEDSLLALRRRGYLVLYGASSGAVPPFDLIRLTGLGSLYVTRPTLDSYVTSRAELMERAADVFSWVADGRLEVRIGGRYPLAEAARAHADLASRATTGKLLLLTG